MENDTELLPNIERQFTQIGSALKLESGSPDFDSVRIFHARLRQESAGDCAALDLRRELRLEEALVWRILADRILRELGPSGIFQLRDKGAASGTAATHPAIETLAKTYERLRRAMEELTPTTQAKENNAATGLPMRMMKVLEETEGFLEHALGLATGERSPFSPGLRRGGAEDGEDDL